MPITPDSPRRRRKSRRDEYLTPNQVADQLLVAPVTVRLWANRGLLPSETTPGGHRRFLAREVAAFIARRRQDQEAAAAAPKSLLVIDDDAQYTRYVQALLATRAPALQVETAPDGFTAGVKCESMRPDIITLDLQMPGMNGLEVCRLLRAKFGPARPRIVVVSGYLSEERIALALQAGASACVAKGAPADTLLRELGMMPTEMESTAA
jgi:CheY-like chemotaxis protein